MGPYDGSNARHVLLLATAYGKYVSSVFTLCSCGSPTLYFPQDAVRNIRSAEETSSCRPHENYSRKQPWSLVRSTSGSTSLGMTDIIPRPGDNPNQCGQGYNCPPPTVTLDPFMPFGNVFVDVGAGGPNPFTFTAVSNASWLILTPSKGSVSPSQPEQRVFVSVDWSKLTGVGTAQITFTATASKQPASMVPVMVVANHTTVPSGFSGTSECVCFVQSR